MKKSKKNKAHSYKFVEVLWRDATSPEEWIDTPETHVDADVVDVISRGWLVKKTKRGITLASTITDDDAYGEVISIPIGFLVSLTELEVKPK